MSISVVLESNSVDSSRVSDNTDYTTASPPSDKQSFRIGEIRKNPVGATSSQSSDVDYEALQEILDALGWQVPLDLLAANTQIVADDRETRDTSLTAILGRRVSRQWRPSDRREAIAFLGEARQFHQLRYTLNPPIYDGKEQRYDARANSGQLYFLPAVPLKYRQKIADSYSLTVPQEGSFWDWVQIAPDCPVFDCEGDAKALSVLALGYASCSGFGAFGGIEKWETVTVEVDKRRSGKKGGKIKRERTPIAPRLPKPLLKLSEVPRRIVLVPDVDADPKTRRMVANAWLHRATLLEKRGCVVRIAYWDKKLGKGIDDVIKNHGADVAREILDNPLTPQQYRLKIELSFELARPNAIVNTRNLHLDTPDLPQEGLVFSDSAVGTGKTKLSARETEGRTLLAPYPLRSLAKAASEPLNADYRNEGKLNRSMGAYHGEQGLSDRLTIVYDSIKNIDITNQFAGELDDLLLDEVTHGLRHMLTGATCKKDRLAIVEKFIEGVRRSKRVLAFDADLTRVELDMLRELRPGDAEFYLQNRRKPDPWDVRWIELCGKDRTIGAAIDAISKTIETRKMIHWACDSRKTSEKIAAHLERGYICAVVNSDRLAQKDPLALAAVSNDWETLDQAGVQIIITSPSVVQGVNWQDSNRFGLVAGTFSGCSISPRQMFQALSRVREAVPRIVWAAPFRRIPGKWGNETDPNKIKARILDVAKWNSIQFQSDFSSLSEARAIAVDWASRLIAADNLWASTPADSLRVLLEHNGHCVSPMAIDSNGEGFAASSEKWEFERQQAILEAPQISHSDYLALKAKSENEGITNLEALALERYSICDFYAIDHDDLDSDLIKLDDEGRYRRQVVAFEQLLMPDGEQLARKRSEATIGMADFDADRSLVARQTRTAIGLPKIIELFQGGGVTKDNPQLIEFSEFCQQSKGAIKTALNFTVSDSKAAQNSPIRLAAELLNQIGVSLACTRQRTPQGVVRFYCLDGEAMGSLQKIAEKRYQRRLEADQGSVSYPSGKILPDGYDTPLKTPLNIDGNGDGEDARRGEAQTVQTLTDANETSSQQANFFNPHDRNQCPGAGWTWDEWDGWVRLEVAA